MYTLKNSVDWLTVTRVGPLALCSVLLTACGTFGSDPDFQSGFYAAGSVGVSNLEPNTDPNSVYDVEESQSTGGQFAIGYDLSSRFSIEGHVAELGEAELSPEGEIGYQEMGISGLIYGLNDRIQRNERTGFSLFGRLGAGSMKNQSDTVSFNRLNDVSLLAGAGLEYGFHNGLAARGEVIAYDKDAQIAMLGLVYRFGDRDTGARITPAVDNSTPSPSPVVISAEGIDSDADGVANAADQCPSTIPGASVGANGCALFNGVIEGVNFESGSANLTADAKNILNETAVTLNQNSDVRLLIEAHTDNQGSAVANLELSKKRALAVARYLADQGINPGRLQPQAFGESKPRVSNATREGRKANRRVEFRSL